MHLRQRASEQGHQEPRRALRGGSDSKKQGAHHPGFEISCERNGYALLVLAHFFRRDAQEIGLGLVAEKHLVAVRTEASAGGVPRGIARRIGESILRQQNYLRFAGRGDFVPRNLGRVRRHAWEIEAEAIAIDCCQTRPTANQNR